MTADPELVKLIVDALRPRLIRTIPEGQLNAGAQEWEQNGAEEIADEVAAHFVMRSSFDAANRALAAKAGECEAAEARVTELEVALTALCDAVDGANDCEPEVNDDSSGWTIAWHSVNVNAYEARSVLGRASEGTQP